MGVRGGSSLEDAAEAAYGGSELRYVLREERVIRDTLYSVEMATDGLALAVSIYDAEGDQGLELLISEENHRALFQECNGSYVMIAERLALADDQLFVAPARGHFAEESAEEAELCVPSRQATTPELMVPGSAL